MRVGQRVRTAISLPGIPAGTLGTIKEVGRVFVVVVFQDRRQGYYARRQLVAEGCCQEGEGVSDEETTPLGVADARVPRGTHVCLLPSSREAAVSAVARYAAAGVHNGELTICTVPPNCSDYLRYCLSQLGVDSARDAHDLRVVAPSEVYLPASEFTASAQLERVDMILRDLAREDARPIRACGFAQGRHRYPGWWDYEERVTSLVRATQIVCLCVYHPAGPRSKVWSQAVALHDCVLRDDTVTPREGGLAGL